jgi:hypothetical protein
MNKNQNKPRRRISIVFLFIIGIINGVLLKSVKIGLVIGLMLGVFAGTLASGKK